MMKTKIVKITRTWMMLSFTAVMADLFYIIARLGRPAVTLDDAAFRHALPEMLELMLLSAVIVTAFMAAMAYIIKNE